ncbi:hypothetical protein MLD38_004466 [Melastoma candidum]|uniref:Uncharacterized protein n=1 Tax=Melastoma candidum TaxID=119954 RepID=A0ACB9S9N9_9MYRT|nr:hypothetical protein MLD38_004466 [Melastoma candidum]
MATTSTTVSGLSSSFIRRLPLRRRLSPLPLGCTPLRLQLSIAMSLGGSEKKTSTSESESGFGHNGDVLRSYVDGNGQSLLHAEHNGAESMGKIGLEQEETVAPSKRAAKIHDFCLGIPFGGLIFSGGLFGFVFSRNPVALRTNVPIGGALLALSTLSLKVWRSGKSSLHFMLGQIVLSGALFWQHFRTYSLTKRAFPSLFYVIISSAMLCFYSYVILAGGNPPPKKLKPSAYTS